MTSSSLQPILAWLGYPAGGNPTQYVTEKAFRQHELDWRYLTVEVQPEDLCDAVRGMRALGFAGGNVGSPHKEAVLAFLDRATETASLVGAANVILRDEGGLVGDNTEGRAAVEAIRQRLDVAEKRVLLIGAGRMARAIACELVHAGAGPIAVLNRTATRAAELAHLITDRLQGAAACAAWDEPFAGLGEIDVVIHATSLAEGDPDAEVPLEWTGVDPRTLVVDATIDPAATRLLETAAAHGCATVHGVEILSRQAAMNVELWTGAEPDLSLLQEALEEFLEL
ncbi:MAG: shikimate dehydrogenase [Pirellulales bacterium]|nr:shikimate dehydrogenase [Pirellulales bacterium]